MRNLIYTCFNKDNKTYIDYLNLLLEESENYSKTYRGNFILSNSEKRYINYIIDSFESSGKTPGKELFEMVFEETKDSFEDSVSIPLSDLRVYIYNLIDFRVKNYISDKFLELSKASKEYGITPEIEDEFNTLNSLSNRNKVKDIDINIDSKKEYENMKLRPKGMKTGIKSIDDKIGGMSPGTVTVIAGFTSQYKTTFAVNIAHLNAYHYGFNIVYISLETPKQDMNWNFLSLHSYNAKFNEFTFIGHDKIRHCRLNSQEEDFIFNVVESDLKGKYTDDKGIEHDRGRIIILDESDFNTFSFGEISTVLERIDDELNGELDAVIVDYAQLCKFSGSGLNYDTNTMVNSYVAFFRRLSQNFRHETDENGNDKVRQLSMILLSQINRTSYQKAVKNEGKYDLTCLADANELERGAFRVFTTFTTEEMKERKAAQVQILKNRTGQTMYEPSMVYADGEMYLFCDEDANSEFTLGTTDTSSLSDAFASLDDSDLSLLGL